MKKRIAKALFYHLKNQFYFTIDILRPYKTDKGEIAYFLEDNFIAYELEKELIKAIKGENPDIEAIEAYNFN